MSFLPFGWLRQAYPDAMPGVLEALEEVCAVEAQLNAPRRLAYFVAQGAIETDRYKTLREYGSEERFMRLYEGRKDLGNIRPGDGARYCGRGLLMTTGRFNYRKLQQVTGLPVLASPELLEEPKNGALAAAQYWTWRECNTYCDKGQFTQLTKVINGGYTHLNARRAELARIWQFLRREL